MTYQQPSSNVHVGQPMPGAIYIRVSGATPQTTPVVDAETEFAVHMFSILSLLRQYTYKLYIHILSIVQYHTTVVRR